MEQLTYNNDPKLKALCVARCEDHVRLDHYLRGQYKGFDENGEFRGCAIGCHVYDADPKFNDDEVDVHEMVASMYGRPLWLCYLEDRLFEGITAERAKEFPLTLSKAIPTGKNLDAVYHKLQVFIQGRNKNRVETLSLEKVLKGQVIAALEAVIDCHNLASAGQQVDWSAARSTARSAAESAWSAAESTAESAAWSGRSAEYDAIADELIRLLKELH